MLNNTAVSGPAGGRHRTFHWYEAWFLALTRPNDATFNALLDDPKASARKAYGWVFLAATLNAALTLWQPYPEFQWRTLGGCALTSLILGGICTLTFTVLAAILQVIAYSLSDQASLCDIVRMLGNLLLGGLMKCRGWNHDVWDDYPDTVYLLGAIFAPFILLITCSYLVAPWHMLLRAGVNVDVVLMFLFPLTIYILIAVGNAMRAVHQLGVSEGRVVTTILIVMNVGLVAYFGSGYTLTGGGVLTATEFLRQF